MKCRECGAEIPEGKIYCEVCGTAIQMVPDYNPVDDISIGTEENKILKPSVEKEEAATPKPWYKCFRYGVWAVLLVIICLAVYQISYLSALETKEVVEEEPEEVLLLEKPTFSVEPGVYDYSPQLVISHAHREGGVIYYTKDGTTPDENSEVYNRPIEIGEGTTVIRAVFIRADGVSSEEADGTYEVIFDYPAEPVFSIPSGEYAEGFYVSLSAETDCTIYYTTNGEEPDRYAKVYQSPIYVNPGLTVIQAIAIDGDGGESGIEERIYKVPEPPAMGEIPQEEIPAGPPPEGTP